LKGTELAESNLENLVICPGCRKTHAKCSISDGADACCSGCGLVLYRSDSKLIERGLAINVTALIFLGIAASFPLISIELLGIPQFLSIPKSIYYLFNNGFFMIGISVALLVLVIPLITDIVRVTVLLLLKYKMSEQMSRRLLILLSKLQPWVMSEIFLVGILIAQIKLIGYAQVHFGISFWALAVYAMIKLYNNKVIHISELWSTRDKVFGLHT